MMRGVWAMKWAMTTGAWWVVRRVGRVGTWFEWRLVGAVVWAVWGRWEKASVVWAVWAESERVVGVAERAVCRGERRKGCEFVVVCKRARLRFVLVALRPKRVRAKAPKFVRGSQGEKQMEAQTLDKKGRSERRIDREDESEQKDANRIVACAVAKAVR